MKITVIGGGSTYTPEFMEGLILREEELGLEAVTLHDIDEARLETVGTFCRRMARAAGAGFHIESTSDLDEALRGTDFVVTQIRVGGQAARHEDILLGTRHGVIGQETTGVGGFAKALRTIPAILEICERAHALVPDAWVVNFTNPASIITEAILRKSPCKAVGLCNVPIEIRMEAAKSLGVEPDSVDIDYVGLNHLGWVRRIEVGGQDILPAVLEAVGGSGSLPANIPDLDVDPELLGALGYFPNYYLRYYYFTDEMLEKIRTAPKTRAQEVMEVEEELLALYRDESVTTKPEALGKRGGAWYSRVAVDVISALAGKGDRTRIVNHLNGGIQPSLPDDASMEMPCRLSRDSITMLPSAPMDDRIAGLVAQVKAYERLTIDAAVTGSRASALMALVNHPLVPSYAVAKAVLDDLVAAGRWTPRA